MDRRKVKFIVLAIVLALVGTGATRTSAQVEVIRNKKPTKSGPKTVRVTPPSWRTKGLQAKGWTAAYTIIVRGKKKNVSGNKTEEWEIKRDYSGEVHIDQKRPRIPNIPGIAGKYANPRQIAEARKMVEEQPDAAWDEPRTPDRIFRNTSENIEDYQLVITSKGGGEMDIVERTWQTGETKQRRTGGGAFMTFHLKDMSFELLIPYAALDQNRPIRYGVREKTVTREMPNMPWREKLPEQIHSVSYPDVPGLLNASGAIHFKSQPGELNLNTPSTWTYESDLLDAVNMTDQGVRVRVIIHFTRAGTKPFEGMK